MTVNTATNRVAYLGDGATTVFTVPFRFLVNSHIVAVLRDAADVETAWVENTNYTLAGAGNDAGTLTVKTTPTDYTPATGETLVILRDIPVTQESDYVENDPLPAETLERDFDKAAMINQQQAEALDRTFTVPETDTQAGNLGLPIDSVRANKDFQFDILGKPLMVEPTDASGTSVTATGSTTSRQLAERFAERKNALDNGVVPGGSDTSAAVQAMFDASSPNDVYYFPGNDYGFATQVDLPDAHPITILGDGIDNTNFKALSAMSSVFNKADTTEIQRPHFGGFTVNCDRLANSAFYYGRSNEASFECVRTFRHLTKAIHLGTGGSRGGTFFRVYVDGDLTIAVSKAQDGIYAESGSEDNKFLLCTVKYCTDSDMHFIGTSNTVTQCHLFGGATKCVRASANTVIVSSYLDTPDDVAVEINAVGVVVVGNRIFANTGSPLYNANAVGIRLVGGARNPVIVGNFFRNLDREIDFGSAFAKPGLSWGNSSDNIATGTLGGLNFATDDMVIKGDNDAEARAMIIRTQAAQEARLIMQTLGNRRWQIYKDGSAEGGSNAGANLSINRYTDAGGFLGTAMQIRRDTGETRILEGLRLTGNRHFDGGTAIAKPTVTGATGGNVALQNLLTALANLGMITDSTT